MEIFENAKMKEMLKTMKKGTEAVEQIQGRATGRTEYEGYHCRHCGRTQDRTTLAQLIAGRPVSFPSSNSPVIIVMHETETGDNDDLKRPVP